MWTVLLATNSAWQLQLFDIIDYNANRDALALKTQNSERGRKNVEAKLLKSACKLLAERGPRAVTVRDIAADAGVNHGQIHHYYGGKRGLLVAAMRQLAQDHATHTSQRKLDQHYVPPPFSLARDQQYAMSVVRSAIDGDPELATLEVKEGISVPRHILDDLMKSRGDTKSVSEIKSALAVAMAIELAWAVLEPYILLMIDAKPEEVETIRQRVGEASREPLRRLEES